MDIYTIDLETFYSKDYSLSKLTTEAYVRSREFETIMMGMRLPNGESYITHGKAVQYELDKYDFSDAAILHHNALFDASILSWHYGVSPKAWLDTLCMARAMHGLKGNSLAALAIKYNLGNKGDEVVNMMGRRRDSLTTEEFNRYAAYCLKDVQLTWDLFVLMSQGWYNLDTMDIRHPFPLEEYKLIDVILRMFTEPMLRLNPEKLKAHLAAVQARKAALLARCGMDKGDLMSNPKFAELLTSFGIDPPMKVSPTTGKKTYAFAKTDAGLRELLEHPDERVQAIVAARMGVKSTLEETRTERFLEICSRNPLFPVPIKYAAARTHRLGGTDKINLQNLSARGSVDAGKLKDAIEAPEDHVIIDCDSSQIEARVLAWLAEQEDLVNDFRNKVDIYSKMATRIYGRVIDRKRKVVVDGVETKPDEREGFVGKTVILGCFGANTLVLTNRGWVRIVDVLLSDLLWDGEEWVTHCGLLNQGYQNTETPTDLMLHATADHAILTEHGWQEWRSVHSNRSLFQSAISKARLPSLNGRITTKDTTHLYGAAVGGKVSLIATTSRIKGQSGVIPAQRKLQMIPGKNTGVTQILFRIGNYAKDCLTVLQNVLHVVHARLTNVGQTMAGVVSQSTPNGLQTAENSLRMLSPSMGMISRNLNLTEKTTIKGTNPATSASLPGMSKCLTEGMSKICRNKSTILRQRMQVFDIAYSGPRNRFMVMTAKGPIIVHNCGYGTGALKLQITMRNATPPMDISDEEAIRIVKTYRNTYPQIPRLWRQGEQALQAIHDNNSMWFGRAGVVLIEGNRGVKLPNGLYISYPSLHKKKDADGKDTWWYKDENGIQKIHGAKFVENVVQALARIIVMQQMLKISKKLTVTLPVHDAVASIAHKSETKEAREYHEACMRWVPKWAEGCPIDCESGVGLTYGEC